MLCTKKVSLQINFLYQVKRKGICLVLCFPQTKMNAFLRKEAVNTSVLTPSEVLNVGAIRVIR